MKNHILLLLMILLSCSEYRKDDTSDREDNEVSDFEFIVFDSDYASAYSLEYVLTPTHVQIRYHSGLVGGKDTVFFSMDLEVNEAIKVLSNLELDSLEDYYSNMCIDDGSQLFIQFTKGGETKDVQLSNYYHPVIGLAVEQINSIVPEKYGVWYNKEVLLPEQKRCEAQLKTIINNRTKK